MKKFLSIEGWNPGALRTGDHVICIIGSKGHEKLRTGVVGLGYGYPEEEEKKRNTARRNNGKNYSSWYVIDDITGKKLYPYTQNTCLLTVNINVKELCSVIVEID